MKNLRLIAITAVFTSSALTGTAAIAEGSGKQPYVTNEKGVVVRVNDRQGRCVRTVDWTEETATKECDPHLFPEPVEAAPVYEQHSLSANALFAFDSAEITAEGMTQLQALGDKIRAKGAQVVDIDIIGHTDSMGPEEYNQQLSMRRATAMKDFLVNERGIEAGIIDISGMGESSPIADNATPEGRAQNRRVEVHVGVKAPK